MNKFFLLCLLGLAYIAAARNLQGAAQCDLTFYGPPPAPVCNVYIDENGQEQTECYAVGPAASRAILNSSQKTLNVASDSLYELDFGGACKCTLVLYSKANYKGSSYSYAFSKAKDGVIFGNQIWKTANKSYKISCTF